MARRALRYNDADLDLCSYLTMLDQVAHPWRASEYFGRQAPLVIEVGSGKGMFMVATATGHPELNVLGIEIAPKYARFCAARLARRSVRHAKMICGPAEPFFTKYLSDQSVYAVHVYFPDPWWKRRHHRRRLLKPEFVAQVERVLQPGGQFHFWTDVKEYYEATLDTVAAATRLEGPVPVTEREPSHDLDYQTNFERRTRLNDQPVYRSYFRKPA